MTDITDETEAAITGTTPRRNPKPEVDEIGGHKLKAVDADDGARL